MLLFPAPALQNKYLQVLQFKRLFLQKILGYQRKMSEAVDAVKENNTVKEAFIFLLVDITNNLLILLQRGASIVTVIQI